jgi:hypothetical protein
MARMAISFARHRQFRALRVQAAGGAVEAGWLAERLRDMDPGWSSWAHSTSS